MTASNFSPMSAPVRSIFDRIYLQLDHAQHYYTAYLLAEGESDLGDGSRPCASIARKRVMDRSDAPQWKVTHADEHATPIIEMDSRLTMKGTTNHIKRAIAEFLYARELEKAAKARENKAAFKAWFGACRKLATETHIEHARDIGSIDIGATRLVYAINYSDAHGNEHADWRNGIRRANRIPYRAEMINDMLALRSIKGRDYRRLLIQEMSQRRRTGMLAPIPGKPNARDVAALESAGNSLFSAEALAELAGIEGVSVTIMTPDNVGDVHNTIAAHIGEPSAALFIAEKVREPNAGIVAAGYESAKDGIAWYENPYASGSEMAYDWDSGHTEYRQEMQNAETLAKANGWTYHVSRMAGNPTFQHSEHGTVMADNWIDLLEQYPIEPSAAELRSMRLFNCQTEGKEPAWRNYKGLELAACRNDIEAVQEEGGNPESDTHIVTCHYEEAEFFSVYLRDKEGLAEALTDIQDRDTVLAVVSELMQISGLPCEFANVFGWR